jgi:hypothetical protein
MSPSRWNQLEQPVAYKKRGLVASLEKSRNQKMILISIYF